MPIAAGYRTYGSLELQEAAMSIKSILLHADATERSAVRLAVARDLAERHDATVSAMFAATPSAMAMAAAGGEGSSLLFTVAQDIDAERRERARRIFDAVQAGPRVSWTELNEADTVSAFAREALTADLLVLGQYDRFNPSDQGVPADFAEAVIIGCGKPALVIPSAGDFSVVGRTVLVAWKPARESARALGAALPLLSMADKVHVASWGHDPRQVERWMLRHGIDPLFHQEPEAASDLGEYILSRAAELGADLLVMGCYGHSRARELVLGGASRTLLDSMTLPVLMAH
jgi:nucleotide-binding universal stress UspA family protein